MKEDGLSVLKASRIYKVPENTIRDRVLGKIDPDNVVMGKVPLFEQFEESKLVDHFKTMANYGYGYTRQECVDIASDYAVELGKRLKAKPLSMKWMNGFLSRWPEMKVLKPRGLEHVRAKMAKESTVMNYFDQLEKCITKHGLADKPHLIFNVDEKGLSVDHRPPYIVASADHSAQAVTSGKGKTVTVLGCGSASGMAIPPYFIFPGKRMNQDLLKGASPGADGTMSETGWSNSEVFRKYLEFHFLKFVPGRNDDSILLILDGHRSHVALGLADWVKQNKIIIFVLPAHTSHILQPLDVACYGPFEKIYNMKCHKVIRETSAAITKYNLCEIACQAYSKALCADNLQAAFKKSGIFPTDRHAIAKENMLPSEVFANDIGDVSMGQCEVGVGQCDARDSDSDATVEGGIRIEIEEDQCDMFEKREKKLKSVKNNVTKKPRNTISKLVAGKELTSEEVCAAISEHERNQKRPTTKPKKESSVRKIIKRPKKMH